MVGFCEVCSGNQCDEQVVSVSNNNNARFLSSLEQNCPLTLGREMCAWEFLSVAFCFSSLALFVTLLAAQKGRERAGNIERWDDGDIIKD